MLHELIYTSSQAGLKSGSKGFCTVAATASMPPRTLTLLESISGYRHLNSPTGTAHPDNPVVYSHLQTRDGQSILSRIADAGLDYSGRTNKLAHHVVVSSSDASDAGPTAMFRQRDFFMTDWSGQPRTLPPRSLPAARPLAGVCNAWQAATGDAGWAAELASTIADGRSTEAYLIIGPNTDALSLIDEAISLLAPADRWRATFTTFHTGLPMGIACVWKCVIAGSPEHQSMPKSNRLRCIDLSSHLGPAPDSELASHARGGTRPHWNAPAKITTQAPAAIKAMPSRASDDLTLAPPMMPGRGPKPIQPTLQVPRLPPAPRKRSRGVLFWLLLTMIPMALLATGGIAGAWIWFNREPTKVADLSSDAGEAIAEAQPEPKPESSTIPAAATNDPPTNGKQEEPEKPSDQPRETDESDSSHPSPKPDPVTEPVTEPEPDPTANPKPETTAAGTVKTNPPPEPPTSNKKQELASPVTLLSRQEFKPVRGSKSMLVEFDAETGSLKKTQSLTWDFKIKSKPDPLSPAADIPLTKEKWNNDYPDDFVLNEPGDAIALLVNHDLEPSPRIEISAGRPEDVPFTFLDKWFGDVASLEILVNESPWKSSPSGLIGKSVILNFVRESQGKALEHTLLCEIDSKCKVTLTATTQERPLLEKEKEEKKLPPANEVTGKPITVVMQVPDVTFPDGEKRTLILTQFEVVLVTPKNK